MKLPLPLRRRRAATTAASAIVMPAALDGAIPTLQALQEAQRLLFFAESLVRLHRWHCHKTAMAEADLSELDILQRIRSGGSFGGAVSREENLGRKDNTYQFCLVELTCMALGTDQNSPPYIKRRESQRETQLSVACSHSCPPAPLPAEFSRFCEMKYLLEKETHNKNEENTLKELNEIFR